jgi:HSP20 family protein
MFTLPLPRRSLWDSFQDLERLFEDMGSTISTLRSNGGTVDGMPINVWSTPDGLVVNAETPGVAPADVSVSVLDNTLTIRAQRGGADASDVITRTVQLPYRVDGEHTEARSQNGILTVVLRRPETEKPRRIAVQAA